MEDVFAMPAAESRRMRLLRASDERLVRRAAGGDESAFAEIFERYHQEIYRYCRAILGNPDDAQDALQSTMASVLRALPGERREIVLRPWLYRVARNESLSHIRSREATAQLTDEASPPQPAADIVLEQRDAVRTLVQDLTSLPERQRSALVMRELSGLSHDEVATALHVSPQAVRQAVYEARTALHEFEEGRTMECDRVRAVISEKDGRVLRGRKVRAHMRECRGCSDFALAIDARRTTLAMMAPPLPAVAASGLIAAVTGAGSVKAVAGGGVAAGAAGVSAGSVGLKSIGLIAASAAIGVGAGTIGGVELPVPFGGSERAGDAPADKSQALSGASGTPEVERAPGASPGGPAARPDRGGGTAWGRDHRSDGFGGRGHAQGQGQGGAPAGGGASAAAPGSAAGGASSAARAEPGRPETPPGSSVAADRSNRQSNTPTTGPPEHTRGGGLPAHSNAGGAPAGGGNPNKPDK